jgi:sulfate transport system substrate-binding protein
MRTRRFGVPFLAAIASLSFVVAACSSGGGTSSNTGNASLAGSQSPATDCSKQDSPVVTFAAYSNVYDVYGKLQSDFASAWKDAHDGQQVIFQSSYGGSTTQAQNVVNGFPADVVALSLAPDVQMIQDAGLITHDWTQEANGGITATSDVVFDVRPNNPKHIENWNDLTQPGLQILTPDPAQSGGAKWNIIAAYGAAMRGQVPGVPANDPAAAQKLLTDIFKNVTVMDKSANDSIKNFQSGNGDVAITYEYAVLQAQHAGLPDERVIPPSTVSIQTPIAVVDKNAEAHCVEDIANAFVKFVLSKEEAPVFTSVGFERSVDVKAAQKGDGDTFPAIQDLFTVDDLGGWDQIETNVFGDQGAFTKALADAQG